MGPRANPRPNPRLQYHADQRVITSREGNIFSFTVTSPRPASARLALHCLTPRLAPHHPAVPRCVSWTRLGSTGFGWARRGWASGLSWVWLGLVG